MIISINEEQALNNSANYWVKKTENNDRVLVKTVALNYDMDVILSLKAQFSKKLRHFLNVVWYKYVIYLKLYIHPFD